MQPQDWWRQGIQFQGEWQRLRARLGLQKRRTPQAGPVNYHGFSFTLIRPQKCEVHVVFWQPGNPALNLIMLSDCLEHGFIRRDDYKELTTQSKASGFAVPVPVERFQQSLDGFTVRIHHFLQESDVTARQNLRRETESRSTRCGICYCVWSRICYFDGSQDSTGGSETAV